MAWVRGKIARVVDGDTIVVISKGRKIRGRIIGIDTPESFKSKKLYNQSKKCNLSINEILHMGRLSKIYTKHKLPVGSDILFLSVKIDYYGRELIWVKGFNFEIVRDGFAQVYAHADIKYRTKKALFAIEAKAKASKKGIWNFIKKDCL